MNPIDYVNPDRVNSPLDPSGEADAAWRAVRSLAALPLAQARKTIAGLRESTHHYRLRADNADNQVQALKTQLATFTHESARRGKVIDSLRTDARFNEGLRQDAIEARRQLGECRDECDRLRATNADLRNSLTHEHTDQTSLVKCRDECNKLRNENESLRSQRDNSTTNTDKASRMVSDLTAELAGLRQRITELHLQRCDTTEENSLRTLVENLRAQLKSANNTVAEKISYIDGLLQSLGKARQDAKADRARADAHYVSWSKSSHRLTQAREGLDSVRAALTNAGVHWSQRCKEALIVIDGTLQNIYS